MKAKTRESISLAMRFYIFRRDKFTCQYCGAKAPDTALHVEHIVPVVKGGTNDPTNLCAACIRCNVGKGTGDRDTDEERPPTVREEELEDQLEQEMQRVDLVTVALLSTFRWPAEFRLFVALLANEPDVATGIEPFAILTRIPTARAAAYMRGLDATGFLRRPALDPSQFRLRLPAAEDGIHRRPLRLADFTAFDARPSVETVYG